MEVYSIDSIKNALLTNTPQVYAGKELFKTNEQEVTLAKIFTNAMHGKSLTMAGPDPIIDLFENKCLLDIGGGSGTHSINVTSHSKAKIDFFLVF